MGTAPSAISTPERTSRHWRPLSEASHSRSTPLEALSDETLATVFCRADEKSGTNVESLRAMQSHNGMALAVLIRIEPSE